MTIKNNTNPYNVLVTGAAGFIGFHFTRKLLSLGYNVTGIDNLNHYYDVNLKLGRLKEMGFSGEQLEKIKQEQPVTLDKNQNGALTFFPMDLKDNKALQKIFSSAQPEYVVHLAAQTGVRYSVTNPYAYIDSNIIAFLNMLENCRHHQDYLKHLVYSSSSSVYGSNENMPFSVHHNVDHPVSLYAATKKANELIAHSYSHLYGIPSTGLRFFTVYGPWGRPDMSYFLFTKKILAGIPIEVFNNGNMKRDFTYIDDITTGIYNVMLKIPVGNPDWDGRNPDPATSRAPYRIFNIGSRHPVPLLYFIALIEKHLGKKAEKKLLPLQDGDMKETYADTETLKEYTGFEPSTPVEEGIARFVEWYVGYYGK
ncbi:MAG: NAD-dependent epimerase/dehydratase family protein [Acidobacteria bacterium]|nr:NAD-dependent epimerase/dehydratase family protein [Acidobacteriota bacterium]